MMKKIAPVLLSALLLLSACGPASQTAEGTEEASGLSVAATTNPVYLLAGAVIGDVPGVSLSIVADQPMSCLHDYTLDVKGMQMLERADAILLSGAGLEDTIQDALDAVPDDILRIDCSQGIELLPLEEHHEDGDEEEESHDHGEYDPHIWMDPRRACEMLDNIAAGLAELDPDNGDAYAANAESARTEILSAYENQWKPSLDTLPCRELITFHDGFAYFADAFDLTILRSIEEEAGSEASAREVAEIMGLIREHELPALFTELNGSVSTAQMISRECDVPVYALDLIMSYDQAVTPGTDAYLDCILTDVSTIIGAYTDSIVTDAAGNETTGYTGAPL